MNHRKKSLVFLLLFWVHCGFVFHASISYQKGMRLSKQSVLINVYKTCRVLWESAFSLMTITRFQTRNSHTNFGHFFSSNSQVFQTFFALSTNKFDCKQCFFSCRQNCLCCWVFCLLTFPEQKYFQSVDKEFCSEDIGCAVASLESTIQNKSKAIFFCAG